MAIHRIYSEKDASIGSKQILPGTDLYGNEGRDEILEIGKYEDMYGNILEKRILIQFPHTEVQQVLSQISGSYTATLNIKHCSVRGILKPRVFSISNISGSWEEGVGKKYELPSNKVPEIKVTDFIFQEGLYVEEQEQEYVLPSTQTRGVNWKTRTGMEGSEWITLGGDTYFETVNTSYPSSELDLDFVVDVTPLLTGSINGFMVKLEEEYVGDSYLHNFFSKDTHTVYQPYLDIKWRDQEWSSFGDSLPSGKDFHIELSPQSLTLYPNQECKLYISPKVKFPVRVFSTSSLYVQHYTLPSSSMWRVRDDNTGEFITEFDSEHTLIHSDQNGNYVKFNTSLLEPERYYRLEVKIPEEGTFRIVNTKTPFKLQ